MSVRTFVAWFAIAALASCGSSAPQCVYDSDCGELAVCKDPGVCLPVECVVADDCGFGQYCDEANACKDGCTTDRDCEAGTLCDVESHECEAYGCRTTELDCTLGEYCDTDSGECLKDDRGHCEPCDAGAASSCGNNSSCFIMEVGEGCTGDNQCDDGWYCDALDLAGKSCHLDFCLVECNPDAEMTCPRGLSCVTGIGSNPSQGYCIGDCTYLTENGFLE